MVLPFNNNKWSFVLEPTITYNKYDKKQELSSLQLNYTSFDLNFGGRHRFYLENNSNVFITGEAVFSKLLNTDLTYHYVNPDNPGDTRLYEYDLTVFDLNFLLGVGYEKDNYSCEFRYSTARDLLNQHGSRTVKYGTYTVVIGYTIFDNKKK